MTAKGGVLALDLAGVVGWAYGHIDQPTPEFGTWQLPHTGGEGARYAAFENELAEAMERFFPAKLLLEAPLPLPAMNNRRSAFQQITLRGIAYCEGWRESCPVFEIDAPTVRGDVLGQRFFAKDGVKREVVAYCRRRGWRVPDHNAADACLLWEWHRARMASEPPVVGRLFSLRCTS